MASKRKQITKEQPRAKKVKNTLGPKFEEITLALETLPLADEVKKMLAEVLPCSLGEFSDQRDKFQERVIEAVAGVLGDVKASLKAGVDATRLQCGEATSKKPQHKQDTTDAAAKLEVAKAETYRLKVALADRAVTFRAATDLLADAESAKRMDAQASQEAGKKKAQLEAALESFKVLNTMSLENPDAQKKRDDLVAFLRKHQFEESILIALPVALTKAPETRGQFDLIAINQLEADIGKRIIEQETILSEAKPGQEKCEAAVEDAVKRLNTARVEQRAAAKAFDAASQQQHICEELSIKAQTALRELEESWKRSEKELYAAEVQVELFDQGPMETFKALCTRATPAAEPAVEETEDQQVEQTLGAPEVVMTEAAVAAVAAC